MRTIVFCLLTVLPVFSCYSQDWHIIKTDEKYNYQAQGADIIETTIWADSIRVSEKDTLFYLNHIVEDCESCTEYVFRNVAQFLQKEVIKTDSSYNFGMPEHFVIKHKANEAGSWIFDTSNNITAQIASVRVDSVFGRSDSLKIIALSTLDTIVLSKNYGILRFDAVYKNERYNLAGINNKVGTSVPDFYDFYDFSVGDVFAYEGSFFSANYIGDQGGGESYYQKVEILTKDSSEYGFEYSVHIEEQRHVSFLPPWEWSFTEYNDKWTFSYSKNHSTNRFNKELVSVEDNNFCGYEYTVVHVTKDKNNLYTKQIGAWESGDYFSVKNDNSDTLIRQFTMCDEHEFIYKEGLGVVKQTVHGFEWYSNQELIGYIKNNDTAGIVNHISDLQKDTYDQEAANVFPNPAKDIIYIEANSKFEKVKLIDLHGKVIKEYGQSSIIDLNNLQSGIYFLRIEFKNKTIVKKIFVNAS